jgi:hypothetical protein
MDVVGHDDLSVNIKIDMLLAPGHVFDDKIIVIAAGEYIYPIDYG